MPNLSDLEPVSGAALVMGAAPSLLRIDPAKFQGLRIGVGDVPVRASSYTHFDYWVTANSHFPLPWVARHRKAMNRGNFSRIVFATSAMSPISVRRANSLIATVGKWSNEFDMTIYDQRHELGDCEPISGCCIMSQNFVRDKPIQHQVWQQTGLHYKGSHSVIFHGIALAILMRAKPIYIAGVDLPFRNADYIHALSASGIPTGSYKQFWSWKLNQYIASISGILKGDIEAPSMFAFGQDEIREDLLNLGSAAKAVGSELINLSPSSLMVEIPTIEQDFEYLEVKGS